MVGDPAKNIKRVKIRYCLGRTVTFKDAGQRRPSEKGTSALDKIWGGGVF